jgi:hypothetical protein
VYLSFRGNTHNAVFFGCIAMLVIKKRGKKRIKIEFRKIAFN